MNTTLEKYVDKSKIMDFALQCGIILGLFLYYSVLLDSPYYADDIYNSCIRGNVSEAGIGIWTYMVRDAGGWIRGGRLFPIAEVQYLFFYILTDILAYKCFLILYTLLDIFLLGEIIYKSFGSMFFKNIGMIVTGLIMPVYAYDGVNPMNMFGGLVQTVVLFGFLAIIFELHYFESGKKKWLWASAVCAACGMLTYEPGWIFPVLLAVIAFGRCKSKKEFILTQIPNFIFAGGTAICTILIKLKYRESAYEGVAVSFDTKAILETFKVQFFGAFPFVSWGNAQKPMYLFDNIWECYRNVSGMTVIATGILVIFIVMVIFLQQQYGCENRFGKRALDMGICGILLWLFPALLIAISGKYQQSLQQQQLPYLPFFMEIFGIAMVIIGLLQWGKDTKMFQFILSAVLVFSTLIIVPVYSYAVVQSNEANRLLYKDMRGVLVEATLGGMFADVESGATIVLDNRYIPTVSCNIFSATDPALKTDYYLYQEQRWREEYESQKDSVVKCADDNVYLVKAYVTEQLQLVLTGKVYQVEIGEDGINEIRMERVKLLVKIRDDQAVTLCSLTYYGDDGNENLLGVDLRNFCSQENQITTKDGIAYLIELDDYIYKYAGTIF